MADSLDFTGLDSTLKLHLQAHPELLTTVLGDDMTITRYVTPLIGVKDEIAVGELLIEDILQPGAKDTFTGSDNTVKFKARKLKVRDCKADITFTPSKISQMYKSFLSLISTGKLNYENVPFEAYIMELLMKKARQNLNTAAHKAIYNADGITPLTLFNGFIKLIDNAIDDEDIPTANILDRVTITNTNAIDTFRALAKKVPAKYWDIPMVLIADPLLVEAYDEDYLATNGASAYNKEFNKRTLDGRPIEIVPEVALAGTGHMFITLVGNLFFGYDDDPASSTFRAEYSKRNIYLMLDFVAGVQIGIAELVWPMALTT